MLRAAAPPGSTVLVEPGDPDSAEPDVKLSIIEGAPKPTPVGVGAEGGDGEPDSEPESSAPEDTPSSE